MTLSVNSRSCSAGAKWRFAWRSSREVARRVTAAVFAMVFAGALAGLALGFGSVRYIESLLYQVRPGDPRMVALPALTILASGLLAACHR